MTPPFIKTINQYISKIIIKEELKMSINLVMEIVKLI